MEDGVKRVEDVNRSVCRTNEGNADITHPFSISTANGGESLKVANIFRPEAGPVCDIILEHFEFSERNSTTRNASYRTKKQRYKCEKKVSLRVESFRKVDTYRSDTYSVRRRRHHQHDMTCTHARAQRELPHHAVQFDET